MMALTGEELAARVADPENTQTQWDKAITFHKRGCVERKNEGFVVKRLPGYNKTDHKVSGNLAYCDCFFMRRMGKKCSHIMAVEIFLRTEVAEK